MLKEMQLGNFGSGSSQHSGSDKRYFYRLIEKVYLD